MDYDEKLKILADARRGKYPNANKKNYLYFYDEYGKKNQIYYKDILWVDCDGPCPNEVLIHKIDFTVLTFDYSHSNEADKAQKECEAINCYLSQDSFYHVVGFQKIR